MSISQFYLYSSASKFGYTSSNPASSLDIKHSLKVEPDSFHRHKIFKPSPFTITFSGSRPKKYTTQQLWQLIEKKGQPSPLAKAIIATIAHEDAFRIICLAHNMSYQAIATATNAANRDSVRSRINQIGSNFKLEFGYRYTFPEINTEDLTGAEFLIALALENPELLAQRLYQTDKYRNMDYDHVSEIASSTEHADNRFITALASIDKSRLEVRRNPGRKS